MPGSGYEESISRVLDRIEGRVSGDIGADFAAFSKIGLGDIHPVIPGQSGIVSAIDGSNTIVAESGSFALAAIRAAHATFSGGERLSREITPLRIVTIGPGKEIEDFPILMQECFGVFPEKPLKNNDPERVSAILRSTLEYGIALQQVHDLPAGSLLLLDGTLRVTDPNHEPVVREIIRTAKNRGVLLAAIAKRTNATWSGGRPLLPATAALARQAGATGLWWVKVNDDLLDSTSYFWGRQGDMYVASFHPKKNAPFKLELPQGTDEPVVEKIMRAIAACSNDGRIPGYPYPLLDAHRTVVIDEPLAGQIRQDMMKGFSLRGMNKELFDALFGDLHDAFDRY